MSTAVAIAPLPPLDRHPSPRNYSSLAPSSSTMVQDRPMDIAMSNDGGIGAYNNDRSPQDNKQSPRMRGNNSSKIIVKKEPPSSPSLQGNPRHRPRKLDLNAVTVAPAPPNSGTNRLSVTPLTGRDGLGMHEVGLACLSPGFQTHDPAMREQLQRSISVRDQQRSIIESRLLKSAKGDGPELSHSSEGASFPDKIPSFNSKKRAPPGLSIVPPSAQQFANERVIQSAPLGQTFTGRAQPPPVPRHSIAQPSQMSQPQQIHHTPAVQTSNRLPPITDVFGAGELNPPPSRPSFFHTNSNPSPSQGPPLPSPGFPPKTAHPMSQPPPSSMFERPREYRSAEEAVREMTGGREDLMPKIVHYGGHQPPTPPSPQPRSHEGLTPNKFHQPNGNPTSRRRSRNEYEADSSPPLGTGRERLRYSGPFGEGRDSPATQKAKKEEFLSLCARAWDLFHS